MYRGRLAPSPTGLIHLGTARTALVAWLRARSQGGVLVMRIEDLDRPRVVEGAAEAIFRDLAWLGIDWDEGPYLQSERSDHYERAIAQLRERGRIYPCTCSRKEIQAIASAPHGDDSEPHYPGTCRSGVSHDDGRAAALRFRMPEREPDFTDLLHGERRGRAASDFVLKRADGIYAYQLAVVVDDLAMGITEVVRGDDLLSSTPRQIALYQALGATPPAFLHVPLLLDASGERLAKRHASTAIAELRAASYTPERIVGYLAHSLGLLDHDRSISPSELVTCFELKRLHREPTRVTPPIAR